MTKVRFEDRYLDLFDINKYMQDPEINYDGSPDEEKLSKVVGTIKAVRLG